jgi:hypothetical protein
MGSGRGQSDPFPFRLLAGAALLIAWIVPARRLDAGPVLCTFRRATGLPCPSCGLSRSWSALLHGRFRESVAFHPLGPIKVLAAVALMLRADEKVPGLAERLKSPAIAGSLVTGWVAVWVARLLAARR